jgi:chromate transporter
VKQSIVQPWKRISSIFLTFLKIAPVTFGGGYATIPLIEREVVERRRWLTTKEVADVFAIAQSAPGAIAINSASFIGYRLAGIPGALAATVGMLLPTFFTVLTLAALFIQFQSQPKVIAAFEGIRAAIVALICYAGFKISKTAVIDKTTLALVVTSVAVLFLVVVCGFVLGIAIASIRSLLGTSADVFEEAEEDLGYMMGDGI